MKNQVSENWTVADVVVLHMPASEKKVKKVAELKYHFKRPKTVPTKKKFREWDLLPWSCDRPGCELPFPHKHEGKDD